MDDIDQAGLESGLESDAGYQPADGSAEGLTDDAAGEGYEIDGQKYTADQLREAIEAHQNRESWEKSFKLRDQSMAGVRKAVEFAFEKPYNKLGPQDLNDLKAFGLINARLRSDPEFARSFEEFLSGKFQRQGMSKEAADAKAEATVDKSKETGQPFQLPKEVQDKLSRIDYLEQLAVEQKLEQFQGTLESHVGGVIKKVAADLGDYSQFLRQQILYGLAGYSDSELIRKWKDGELQREVSALGSDAAGKLRKALGKTAADTAEGLKKARAGAGPTPIKGAGTGAANADVVDAKPGRGLSGMSNRLIRDLGRRPA